MKFSLDKNLTFEQAKALFFEQLGDWKIMALASSVNDYVMVRNVSCLFYNDKIYFKTDKDFRKTKQLYENPNVALCYGGIQVNSRATMRIPARCFATSVCIQMQVPCSFSLSAARTTSQMIS